VIGRGDVVQSHRWPESIEVDLIEELGEYVRLVGVLIDSRHHVDDLLPYDEFSKLSPQKLEFDCSGIPDHAFLVLETIRYRFASAYDPLLAMSSSKVDPLPHQIDAVYGKVLKLPRIRFLIADDPGAGKTIMAGLIIKELKLRHLIHKILIVVPGHLKDQWQREMNDRFEEDFSMVDRGLLGAFYGENIWEREAQIITSIDFIKREEVLRSLSSTKFDLIIVDEAHKMSAYRYGDKVNKTDRYKLGEVLSRITEHLLFLTATPHSGDPENYRLFLDLLEPGFFATSDMLQESIVEEDNPLFIRRVKEDMKNLNGEPLFLPRYVKTITFNLGTDSPSEKLLYNKLSEYVKTQYDRALIGEKRRNVAFALVILQRRLASSTYALLKSVERRRARLVDLLNGAQPQKLDERIFDFETVEDLSDEQTWKVEEMWETLSVAETTQERKNEITTLDQLAEMARNIIDSGEEIKLQELRETLEELNKRSPGHKILIFTESYDTLDYLQQRIISWGYSVNTIHGRMNLKDRVKAEGIFKNETQVMVATEAAGEGINLQFCNMMINYDIPWNPNRLEQRMGRIHRYGQTKEVFIYNLVAEDTREGRVLNRLFEKLEEIKAALGSDKVFDVLSEVLYGRNLSQLLLEAAATTRSMDDILKEFDFTVDDQYVTSVKENLGESLATHFINYPLIDEMKAQSLEQRLIPEYTEAFFRKGFAAAGGKIRERKDGFIVIESVPYQIRQIAQSDAFTRQFGDLQKTYPKAIFDREIAMKHSDAEFISFGHPLFEAILEWVNNTMSSSLKQGAMFEDPDGRMHGTVLFYEGDIRDGTGSIAGKRLFAFYYNSFNGEFRQINPAFIWDLVGGSTGATMRDFEDVRQRVLTKLLPALEDYKRDLTRERDRQTQIKQKYGVKSLTYLIERLDGDLISLFGRSDRGEDVKLVIYNKQEQKTKYDIALKELQQTIEREKILTIGTPVFVGAICVQPSKTTPTEDMETDYEVELIGMRMATEYEQSQDRVPEDVSAQNLGFDIRSTEKNGNKRFIEVKARAGLGGIELTQNEIFKARSLSDLYYLYVILNATSAPILHVYRNPIDILPFEEKIERRFAVGLDELNRASNLHQN